MSFIDGENLVIRYQEMLNAGLKRNLCPMHHIPDVFLWHPQLCGDGRDILRVNYYTSVVADDEKINNVRDEIGRHLMTGAGSGRRICAHVFKKAKSSNKTKLVDISITIDVLRYVYSDRVDTVFLFSGDGDYIPLVKEIMRNGKQVVVGAFSSGLNPEMRRVGDQFIDIDSWFFVK